jgi:hypothetical protein
MNQTATPDFFDRLESELREAAQRRPRRWVGGSHAMLVIAMSLGAFALALVPVLAVLGGDRGADQPGMDSEPDLRGARVVATGVAPVAGRWRLETYRSERLTDPKSGEVYQPAGLRCIRVSVGEHGATGQCGEFPRTPGFGGSMHTVFVGGKSREVLLFGRAPEAAARVIVTRRGKTRVDVSPIEGPPGARGDFYLIDLRPNEVKGRINWLDHRGNVGSRGIELLPPASGRRGRGG